MKKKTLAQIAGIILIPSLIGVNGYSGVDAYNKVDIYSYEEVMKQKTFITKPGAMIGYKLGVYINETCKKVRVPYAPYPYR